MRAAASRVKLLRILGVSAAVNSSSILGMIARAKSLRIRTAEVVVTGRKTRVVSVVANASCIPYKSSRARQAANDPAAANDPVAAGFQRHLCSVASRLGACKAPWRSTGRAAIDKRSGPVTRTVAAAVGRPRSCQRLAQRSRRGTWWVITHNSNLDSIIRLGLLWLSSRSSATGLY